MSACLTPLLAVSLALSQQPPVDSTAAKEQVKAALTATGLSFGTSQSGLSYTISFTHKDSPNRMVYVATSPAAILSMKTHVIYSNVWSSKEAPSEALTTKVFTMSKKLGFFYLYKDTNSVWAIRFGVHFDASELQSTPASDQASVQKLKDMIYFVNQVAQETEKSLAAGA